jgi:hypothetical protein
MAKRVGHVTHEGRYVIIPVPDTWRAGDPLPPPSRDDEWFDSFLTFIGVWKGPYDRTPIYRERWIAAVETQARWQDPQQKIL